MVAIPSPSLFPIGLLCYVLAGVLLNTFSPLTALSGLAFIVTALTITPLTGTDVTGAALAVTAVRTVTAALIAIAVSVAALTVAAFGVLALALIVPFPFVAVDLLLVLPLVTHFLPLALVAPHLGLSLGRNAAVYITHSSA